MHEPSAELKLEMMNYDYEMALDIEMERGGANLGLPQPRIPVQRERNAH